MSLKEYLFYNIALFKKAEAKDSLMKIIKEIKDFRKTLNVSQAKEFEKLTELLMFYKNKYDLELLEEIFKLIDEYENEKI